MRIFVTTYNRKSGTCSSIINFPTCSKQKLGSNWRFLTLIPSIYNTPKSSIMKMPPLIFWQSDFEIGLSFFSSVTVKRAFFTFFIMYKIYGVNGTSPWFDNKQESKGILRLCFFSACASCFIDHYNKVQTNVLFQVKGGGLNF